MGKATISLPAQNPAQGDISTATNTFIFLCIKMYIIHFVVSFISVSFYRTFSREHQTFLFYFFLSMKCLSLYFSTRLDATFLLVTRCKNALKV